MQLNALINVLKKKNKANTNITMPGNKYVFLWYFQLHVGNMIASVVVCRVWSETVVFDIGVEIFNFIA